MGVHDHPSVWRVSTRTGIRGCGASTPITCLPHCCWCDLHCGGCVREGRIGWACVIIRPCGVFEPTQAKCHLAQIGFSLQPDRRCGCCGDRRGVAVRPHFRVFASLLFVLLGLVWMCEGGSYQMGVHDHPRVRRVCEPAQAQYHFAHTRFVAQPDRRCGCCGDRRGVAVRPHLSRLPH
jgi:hypothetical protein